MQKNYFRRLINFKVPNSWIFFISGIILGSVLTYIGTKVPWNVKSGKPESSISIVKSEYDPFEKFDIPINDRINSKIRFYLHPGRKVDLVKSYKRSGRYLPMIRAIFEEYNLPQVFVFLPILESGFLPESRSRAGATGL